VTGAYGKVFVVDDDEPVRRALMRVLKAAGLDVEAFGSGKDFLARAAHDGPCCLVVDQRMPDVTGLDLQRRLVGDLGSIGVVFVTGHGDVRTSVAAMKEGAVDFLTKPVDDEDLLAAVGRALSRSADELTRRSERRAFSNRLDHLTPREREVCDLVVQGLLNKQIAGLLGTSEKTVKVHRARAMEKLGVGSVAELARLMERTGTIQPVLPGAPLRPQAPS
jgi:RNA polymerase sigma factor (sigma-70 family)